MTYGPIYPIIVRRGESSQYRFSFLGNRCPGGRVTRITRKQVGGLNSPGNLGCTIVPDVRSIRKRPKVPFEHRFDREVQCFASFDVELGGPIGTVKLFQRRQQHVAELRKAVRRNTVMVVPMPQYMQVMLDGRKAM